MSAPRLITRRDVIREGIARARKALERQHDTSRFSWWRERAPLLAALDTETATKADVDAAAGNTSWARLECNSCGQDVDAAVEVGEPRDYESSTALLCGACVHTAARLLAAPAPRAEGPDA